MATKQLFTNNAISTLASGIGAGDTSLTVAASDGARFPSPVANEHFMATLIDGSNNYEIVKVTARSSDTFTIVRAQEGTSAMAFSTADKVELRLTKGGMERLSQKDSDETITGTKTYTTAPVYSVPPELDDGSKYDRTLARQPQLKDYSETVNALGSVSGSTDIDLANGNVVTATIGGAATFTFSNPPPAGQAGGFTLELTNGGAFSVTWPASVKWPAGTAPSLTSSGVDILTFFTRDGGTTWRGQMGQKDSK